MSVKSILARGRRRTEAIMLDKVRITKPGVGARVMDETTGQYTDPARIVVYEGRCRIQVKADINSGLVETTAGEREWTYLTSQLQVPVITPADAIGSVDDVRPDDVAELLASAHDPQLVGRLFNIQGTFHKSDATYRRWRLREVVS